MSDVDEVLRIDYRSCDVVLELDVLWSRSGQQHELVLAKLPQGLLWSRALGFPEDSANRYVAPFVADVKRHDYRAFCELRRALHQQRDLIGRWSDRGRLGWSYPLPHVVNGYDPMECSARMGPLLAVLR